MPNLLCTTLYLSSLSSVEISEWVTVNTSNLVSYLRVSLNSRQWGKSPIPTRK